MIVCSCYAVSCRRIRSEIRAGASTVKEVGLRCGAGRGRRCGACRNQIKEMIGETPCEGECAESACPDAMVGDTSAAA